MFSSSMISTFPSWSWTYLSNFSLKWSILLAFEIFELEPKAAFFALFLPMGRRRVFSSWNSFGSSLMSINVTSLIVRLTMRLRFHLALRTRRKRIFGKKPFETFLQLKPNIHIRKNFSSWLRLLVLLKCHRKEIKIVRPTLVIILELWNSLHFVVF